MNYLRITLLLLLLSSTVFSNSTNIYQYQKNIQDAKKLYLSKTPPLHISYENSVNNGDTLLIQINEKNISDVKLTFKDINLPFYKNPFKKNSFYALVPISYYNKTSNEKVIISYVRNNIREFTFAKIRVKQGNYKSEKIKVANSKVNLSQNNSARTAKEYKEAMEIYNTNSSEILWKKDFIMPMFSKITSNFGTKRVYNDQLKSFHSGIDFKADVGSRVVAANDGIVKFVGDRFYSGNSIIIDHGQGIYTCYFHLSKILVKENQKVSKKDLIALSGDTGRITGPHLHFGVRVHGELVNPENLFTLLNKLNEKY
ncbi:M23 family metallopeptidase [Arcobacter sp.]|uniref:M23 family metallopeptidase n=1 Tax=Arcobacter sp. TaxID=1872629 RepID=UPI003D0F0089